MKILILILLLLVSGCSREKPVTSKELKQFQVDLQKTITQKKNNNKDFMDTMNRVMKDILEKEADLRDKIKKQNIYIEKLNEEIYKQNQVLHIYSYLYEYQIQRPRSPKRLRHIVDASVKYKQIIPDMIAYFNKKGKTIKARRIENLFKNLRPEHMTLSWIRGESNFYWKTVYTEKDNTKSYGLTQINDVNIKFIRKFLKGRYGFSGKENIKNIDFNIASIYWIWCDRASRDWQVFNFDKYDWQFYYETGLIKREKFEISE